MSTSKCTFVLLVCCESLAIDTVLTLLTFYHFSSSLLQSSYLLSFVMSLSLSCQFTSVRDLIRHVHHGYLDVIFSAYLRAILICSTHTVLYIPKCVFLSFEELLYVCLCTDCQMSTTCGN